MPALLAHPASKISILMPVLLLMLFAARTLSAGPSIRQDGFVADPVFGGKAYILRYQQKQKPFVVLVHGIGNNGSDDWTPTISSLKEKFSILTFDLPGFGRSDKGNKDYSPDRYVQFIRFVTRKFSPKPFHLIGHSLGGAIALRYAATYPRDVRKLIIVDAAGILHRTAYARFLTHLGIDSLPETSLSIQGRLQNLAGSVLERLEQRFRFDPTLIADLPQTRSRVLRNNPSAIAGLSLVGTNFSKTLDQVSAPTLVLWGELDKVAPPRTARVLQSRLQNVRTITFPNAKHNPMRDATAAFNRSVLNFLSSSRKPISNLPVRSSKQAPEIPDTRRVGNCSGQARREFSGTFDRIVIRDCQFVRIHDARVRTLTVTDSSVFIDDSVIANTNTAITSRSSRIVATASTITGKIAILTKDSHLDLAAVEIRGFTAAIKSPTRSTVVFSVSRIDSPRYPDKNIHDFITLLPGSSL